jgi:hypothetical protein
MKLIQNDIFFNRFNDFLYFRMQKPIYIIEDIEAAKIKLKFIRNSIVIIEKRLINRKINE